MVEVKKLDVFEFRDELYIAVDQDIHDSWYYLQKRLSFGATTFHTYLGKFDRAPTHRPDIDGGSLLKEWFGITEPSDVERS